MLCLQIKRRHIDPDDGIKKYENFIFMKKHEDFMFFSTFLDGKRKTLFHKAVRKIM